MPDLTKRPNGGPAADLREAPPSLVKKAQKASTALSMIDLADLDIEVVMVLDGSWSMGPDYENGLVQVLCDRATGFALAADADGRVPLIPFDSSVQRTVVLTAANALGVVETEIYGPGNSKTPKSGLFGKRQTIWPTRDAMGGTQLGAALREARKLIEKSGRFTMVIVVGDGQPGDAEVSTQETIEIGKLGGFVKFVAIRPVRWLDDVDNLERTRPGAREYDNVSSVYIPDPVSMSDLDFYKALTKELDLHIQRATAAGYLS